jgi:DNA-binding transcriptional LysR family regulator
LEIHSDLLTPAQADGLRGGIIDLALLRPPVPGCGIALRTFDVEPLVVVVPANHRLAAYDRVEMRELADEQFVRYGHRDSSLNEAVLRACREAGFAPHTDFEAPTTSVMLGLVAGGFGVALVPAGARAVALEGLTFLDLSPDYRVELALAWNADSDDAVVDAVVGVLGAEYALSGLVEAVGESGP